jgi:hypothetical protein
MAIAHRSGSLCGSAGVTWLVLAATLASGCAREPDRESCAPYTTSEYQRRQEAVVRASQAKERYDRAAYEYEEVERMAQSGDRRAVPLVPNLRRAVESEKANLEGRNAELDQVNNLPPLCPSKAT